jgi:hypothetical protein
VGPCDAYQPPLTRPSRTTLRLHADRPGLPLPVRLVSRICQSCFRPDRPWAPCLQRLLPAVAARSSRTVLSPLPFPTLRCRGSEDSSYSATSRLAARVPPSVRVRSPTTTLFTSPKGRSSPGCFPPSRMTFRPRPALLPDSSLGLCRASAPSTPLAVHREPQRTCALQSVREPEV